MNLLQKIEQLGSTAAVSSQFSEMELVEIAELETRGLVAWRYGKVVLTLRGRSAMQREMV